MVFLTTSDELRVFDYSVREEIEISNVKHMELVYHTKFGPSRFCFANSLRSYKGHLYLLVSLAYFFPFVNMKFASERCECNLDRV
jgi:hypothetical protein